MLLRDNYKSVIDGKNFIFFNIEKSPNTFLELLKGFSVFSDFMAMFNVSAEWIEEQVKSDPHLNVNDFFDYTFFKTPFLEDEKGICSTKFDDDGKIAKTYHDVYVTSSQFVSLRLNVLAVKAMKLHFPKMFEEPFVEVTDIPVELKYVSMDTRVSDFDMIGDYGDYTFGDIYDVIVNGKKNNVSTKFTIYADGWIFFKVTDDYSLTLQASDFFNNDWNAVKERRIISVPLEHPTPKNKWYDGKQGDYFAFGNDIVKMVKETFFSD